MAENNVPQSVWEEKDRRIVRQSSLKVAADLVIAADREKNDIATLSSATRRIAGVLMDWVYEKDDKPNSKSSNVSLPTPTAAQAKVLSKIAAELKQDVETIKPKVLDFAEKNFNMRKYPENVDSVSTFVKALR